jgi:hypothetical protein
MSPGSLPNNSRSAGALMRSANVGFRIMGIQIFQNVLEAVKAGFIIESPLPDADGFLHARIRTAGGWARALCATKRSHNVPTFSRYGVNSHRTKKAHWACGRGIHHQAVMRTRGGPPHLCRCQNKTQNVTPNAKLSVTEGRRSYGSRRTTIGMTPLISS